LVGGRGRQPGHAPALIPGRKGIESGCGRRRAQLRRIAWTAGRMNPLWPKDPGARPCIRFESTVPGRMPAGLGKGRVRPGCAASAIRMRTAGEAARARRAQTVAVSARAVGASGGGGASRQARTAVASLVGV